MTDELVSWSTSYPKYDAALAPTLEPVDDSTFAYTHPVVLKFDRSVTDGGWADPADPRTISAELKARNTYSSSICLFSPPATLGDALAFDSLGRPMNPRGRTGMQGRGLLGKWGPNHAADPIVTRFDPEDRRMLQARLPLPPPACTATSCMAVSRTGDGRCCLDGHSLSHSLTSIPS